MCLIIGPKYIPHTRWRRFHRGSVRLKPATAQTAPFEKLRREVEEEEVNEESQEEVEMEGLVEEEKEYYYFEEPSNIGEVSLICSYNFELWYNYHIVQYHH